MLQIETPAHRVTIHAADACAGKDLLEVLLTLLRSCAEVIEVFACAPGALRRHCLLVAAVVALQALARTGDVGVLGRRLMMRQRDRAVPAIELFSARAAHHCKRVTAPVKQDERLLAALECRFGLL